MKRTPLRRRTPLCRGVAPARSGNGLRRAGRISSRSKRREEDDEKYRAAKAEHFREHPGCQMPGCRRSLLRGHLIDLHHKAGRNGPLLYHRPYFSSLCREHHDYVEEHLSWARANGWIVDLSSDEVWQIRQAEILGQQKPESESRT